MKFQQDRQAEGSAETVRHQTSRGPLRITAPLHSLLPYRKANHRCAKRPFHLKDHTSPAFLRPRATRVR
jgi:hypothetical protein